MGEHIYTEEIYDRLVHYTASDAEFDFHENHVPKMMENHLGGPLGLRLMPPMLISRKDQRLDVPFRLTSPLASLDMIRFIGGKILGEKRVNEFIEVYRSEPDFVAHRQEMLDSGKNIGTYTNHLMRLDDVLCINGLELLALGEERNIQRSASVMSKGITRLQVEVEDIDPLYATDAASFTGTCFYSIPNVESNYGLDKASAAARIANPLMLGAMTYWLAEGSRRLTIALSGSTDIVTSDRIILKRVNPRATQIFSELDSVLAIAVNLNAEQDEPWFKIGNETPRAHNNPDEVHNLMEHDLAPLVAEITGKQVDYAGKHWWQSAEVVQTREKLEDTAQQAGERARRGTDVITDAAGNILKKFSDKWRAIRDARDSN